MAETWAQNFDTGGDKPREFLLTKRSSKILSYRVTDSKSLPLKSWLMIKNSWADSDSAALLRKEISHTPNDDGQILEDGLYSYLKFLISDSDLDLIDTGEYCVAVKTEFANGDVFTHNGATTRVHILSEGIKKQRKGLVTSSGASKIQFGGRATLVNIVDPEGSSLISFSGQAGGQRVVKGSGSSRMALSGVGSLSVVGEVQGSSEIAFSGAAGAKRIAKGAGRSLMQFYSPLGVRATRIAKASGSSGITFSSGASLTVSSETNTFPKWGMAYGWASSNKKPTSGELTDFFAMGAPAIRCDLSWGVAETTKGSYHFDTPTDVLNTMTAHGVKVGFVLDYNNLFYASGQQNGISTQANRDAYTNFVKAAVQQFKGKVAFWEIWNEPDESKFWLPTPNASDYLALVAQVAPVIKQIDPSAYVINGGMSGFDWPFITALLQGGILNYIDGFSVHPYRATFEPETVKADWLTLEGMIAQHAPVGKTIDLFSSEWGYSTYNNLGDKTPATYSATINTVGTNRVYWSTDLKNSAWTKIGATVTSGISDPQSGTDAFRISGSNGFGMSQNGPLSSGKYYLVSCWVRATSGTIELKLGLGTGQLGDVFLASTTWKRVSTLIYYDGSITSTKIFRIASQVLSVTTPYEIFGPQTEELTLTPDDWKTAQELRQANWRTRAIIANHEAGVKCSIDFCFKDNVTAKTPLDQHFGAVYSDETHKLSYDALRTMVV